VFVYRKCATDARFYLTLEKIDADLAATARAGGCSECGGVLHSARYRRKPRGGPLELGAGYEQRHSFCCSVDGCRKRLTPCSVRFLGRKVYLGAVVVVATVLRHGVTPERMHKLSALFGVSRRTVQRWRMFWQETFPKLEFWRQARGDLVPPVDEHALPASLLERFLGDSALLDMLRFIAPITTGSAVIA
jgi:hypothetical protein